MAENEAEKTLMKIGNDIETVEWFKLDDLKPEMFVEEHKVLLQMLHDNLNKK